jgi:hypothetical protein
VSLWGNKIVAAIQDLWPGIPAPEDVRRDDGELLGRIVPTSGGWQAVTSFGASLGGVTTRDEALKIVRKLGLSSLAQPWWMRALDETAWQQVELIEVQPNRIRARRADRMIDQPPSGQWFGLEDVELSRDLPTMTDQ